MNTTADMLRAAALKAAAWRDRRDVLIHKMHDEGASLRAIGAECGLSPAGVKKILDR